MQVRGLLRAGVCFFRPATKRSTRRSGRLRVVVALVALASQACATVPPEDTFSGVERIVAVGDVHGGYDEFVSILRQSGVVDARTAWSGGRTHLVQTGDLLDRGAGSRKVMDLMMRLQAQASMAGGRVHALLGNHEVMNLTGDLRYASAAEFAAFATPYSGWVRTQAYASRADPARRDDPEYRRKWDGDHPLGWVEHREAFGPNGRYGRWIRTHNTVVKIDQFLFLHGGLAPALATLSIREINERVRTEIRLEKTPKDGLASGRQGPLWYRGLAREPEDALEAHVNQLLTRHGVSHIVMGHTTMPGGVVPRFGSKVLLIDVGLSEHYGAHPACLIVERGVASALHRGRPLPLPTDRGEGLVAYLRAAALRDPQPSPLVPLIDAAGRLPLAEDASGR